MCVQSRTQQDLHRNYTTHAHVSRQREVGFNAKVPALTWLVLYYEYQNEVRRIHESIYPSIPNNYTSTGSGRSWLGDEDLRGWLATTIVVTSGTGWSILNLVLILGTLARVVARLATLVASSEDSAGNWVVRWSWVEWSWWTRRHKGASVGCSGGTYYFGSR